MKKILIIFSFFFVLLSFSPSFFEIYHIKDIPKDRTFELVHNYLFDYNFYLSRIRQGQEGRWLLTEKYYNQPHKSSLFQIFYLLLGKIGGALKLSPPFIYHAARLILGFSLLLLTAGYVMLLFPGFWPAVAFLFTVTAGSWPILVKAGNFFRFATYMGWWSVSDSLQRISTIPHVLLGQIFILVFIRQFSGDSKPPKPLKLLMRGITGFAIGIIFPPTLVVVYAVLAILSVLEIISSFIVGKSLRSCLPAGRLPKLLMGRIVFILLSLPSFLYLELAFRIIPWSALPLFDIQHRMPLPYYDYALSLGPILPLGVAGLMAALIKREKKLLPTVSWLLAIGLLFLIFEKVPQQSPLRFTEAAIHIPLGILTAYLFYYLFHLSYLSPACRQAGYLGHVGRRLYKIGMKILIVGVIAMGLGVMVSMVGWLTDQAIAKRVGSWVVPTGAQLIYPLKDFMEGIYFIRDNTNTNQVVLAYVTAGNYIPAYAGNFVYLGHANTPDEEGKEKIAATFFAGKMTQAEAKHFLAKERISYIYFGPQEKELGGINQLEVYYPFLMSIYSNSRVAVYRVK